MIAASVTRFRFVILSLLAAIPGFSADLLFTNAAVETEVPAVTAGADDTALHLPLNRPATRPVVDASTVGGSAWLVYGQKPQPVLSGRVLLAGEPVR